MCDLKPFCTFYSKILQVKYKYNIPNIEKKQHLIKNGFFSTSKNAIFFFYKILLFQYFKALPKTRKRKAEICGKVIKML